MKQQTIQKPEPDKKKRELKLGIPDHADEYEMAAISAAVSALISVEKDEEKEEEEELDSWKMSGRYVQVAQKGAKTPRSMNYNGWKLSSRADRF